MKKLLIGSMWFGVAVSGAASAATEAQAPAVFNCGQPDIPSVSTSADAVRLVEKRIEEWKQCAYSYQAGERSEAAAAIVQKAYDEVVVRRNDWVAASNR